MNISLLNVFKIKLKRNQNKNRQNLALGILKLKDKKQRLKFYKYQKTPKKHKLKEDQKVPQASIGIQNISILLEWTHFYRKKKKTRYQTYKMNKI